MRDLEQQLVAWVDAETEGVDPVTPEEIWARSAPTVAPARRGPSRGSLAIAIAAVVTLLGGLALVYSARDQGPETVHSGPTTTTSTPDWVRVDDVLPGWGWSIEKPVAWTDQAWSLSCRPDTGYLVTNQPQELEPGGRGTGTGGCGVTWSEDDVADPGFVGLELHLGDDPAVDLPPTGPSDAELPIDLEGPQTWIQAVGPTGEEWTTVVSLHDDQALRVRAWAGADAPEADVASLHRMVRSLAWETPGGAEDPPGGEPTTRGGEVTQVTGSSRMATFIACMADADYHPYLADPPQGTVDGEVAAVLTWPAGEQDRTDYEADHERCNEAAGESQRRRSNSQLVWPLRAGPSQTPAEAERDGVIADLAAFPLQDRAVPTRWFDTPEGTWAITKMPDRPDGTDCTIGDPDGAYGTETVCSAEYGEVVLVDDAGRLLRSYPMPGEVPTWIYPTKDAIYAGRAGDESRPESTIARIDRRTLEAEVLVFPPEGGLLGVDLDGWSVAPASADISQLVVVGDDTAGPLVNSTITLTSVDLPAIERLFA
jgi:hypothetical protein